METWGVCGAVFDGQTFDNSSCQDIKNKIFKFWTDFRKELPDMKIETRGTNLSTAIDLASDAVPLRDIYNNISNIKPPPNSPWAALNGDFGMELAGWMSHIAELPENSGYPFRFYTHDPWFINSPWLDRYGRNPHDIYMPLALTRLDSKGKVEAPDQINFLSIDNSYGEMPDQVPDEVIPHIKAALRNSPDTAGPVIWLYPFDEYHEMTFTGDGVNEVFFGDWFMRTAINCGFQMNTVVSSNNFKAALESGECKNKVIVTPTAIVRNHQTFELITKFIQEDGKVIFYGPVNDDKLLEILGLQKAEAISGRLQAHIDNASMLIDHNPLYCAGGIDTVAETSKVIASVSNSNTERAIAVLNDQVAWVRGTNSFNIETQGRYPEMFDRGKYFYPEELMRIMLGKLGFVCEFKKVCKSTPDPVLVSNYNENALYISAYVPDMNTAELLKYPEGAPVFVETETYIQNGLSVYHFPKAVHHECRVFVEMEDGVLKCQEACLATPEVNRRLELSGLRNATLRFRPAPGYEDKTEVLVDPAEAPFKTGEFLKAKKETNFAGTVLKYENVTGKVLISW